MKQLENVQVRHNRIPKLPDRTLLIDTEESPDWFDIMVTGWVPGLEYPFLFEEVSYLIKVPTMVYQMRYRAGENRVSAFRLAVSPNETVTTDTQLYRWPFSNVHSDARVCWTAVNFECELNKIVEKGVFGFLQTTNNADLFGIGRSQNSEHNNYSDFLAAVEERGEVPAEWLLPLSKSVEEFHSKNTNR